MSHDALLLGAPVVVHFVSLHDVLFGVMFIVVAFGLSMPNALPFDVVHHRRVFSLLLREYLHRCPHFLGAAEVDAAEFIAHK